MDDDEGPSLNVRVVDMYTTAGDSNTTLLHDSSPPCVGGISKKAKRSISLSEDDEEGQELGVADIPILPATPISAAAPPLPPSSSSNSTNLVPPSSSNEVVPPPSPSQASRLRPSLRDLHEGGTVRVPGTMERGTLFLPHPNAPKTPKDLGGKESPGSMYVRDRGTPPGSATGEGEMSSASPPIFAPSQPGNYPYQNQPPPPHMTMPPRPTARPIIIQSLTCPPPPIPPPIGPPGAQRRLLPRRPTIYGRIEEDFTTAMGPIPITWSVDPPPTKARIVPQPQGPGTGGPGMIHFGGGQGVGQGIGRTQSQLIHQFARHLFVLDQWLCLQRMFRTVSVNTHQCRVTKGGFKCEYMWSSTRRRSTYSSSQLPQGWSGGARSRSRSFSGVSANPDTFKKNETVPGGRGIKKTNLFGAPAPANTTEKELNIDLRLSLFLKTTSRRALLLTLPLQRRHRRHINYRLRSPLPTSNLHQAHLLAM
ncbi:hypothetical protein BKA70DRAFT_1532492 [Coprinopsis sp. MPI-PUGE-AT-0042]|nr:hypothetical protein BKA70DRAFT_1532492 [Coprinopsis sp. MPI-PUGE-AT-0042]